MPTRPTSVRVARWAAFAAAITAFGSIFNTIWSETPWWEKKEPIPMVAPMENPTIVVTVDQKVPSTVESTKKPKHPIIHVKSLGWDVWVLIASIVVMLFSGIHEILHQIKERKK